MNNLNSKKLWVLLVFGTANYAALLLDKMPAIVYAIMQGILIAVYLFVQGNLDVSKIKVDTKYLDINT
jgi:hypothetical protein